MKSEAGMVVDEDAAFVAHWRMELEEIILRDFGPNAGGTGFRKRFEAKITSRKGGPVHHA